MAKRYEVKFDDVAKATSELSLIEKWKDDARTLGDTEYRSDRVVTAFIDTHIKADLRKVIEEVCISHDVWSIKAELKQKIFGAAFKKTDTKTIFIKNDLPSLVKYAKKLRKAER